MRLLHSQRGVVSVFVSVSLFVFRRCRFLETLWRWAILFDRQLMGCQQANCRAAAQAAKAASAKLQRASCNCTSKKCEYFWDSDSKPPQCYDYGLIVRTFRCTRFALQHHRTLTIIFILESWCNTRLWNRKQHRMGINLRQHLKYIYLRAPLIYIQKVLYRSHSVYGKQLPTCKAHKIAAVKAAVIFFVRKR